MLGRLIKQNLFAVISQLVPLISSAVIVLYFSRILAKDDFGILISLLSLTSFFASITDLGTSNAIIKIFGDSMHRKDGSAGFYIKYFAKIKLIMVLITALLLFIFSDQISKYLFHDYEYGFIIKAVSILFLSYSFIPFLNGMFAAINRYEYHSITSVSINILKILFPLLFLYLLGGGLASIASGLIIAYSISMFIALFLAYKTFSNKLQYKKPKSLNTTNQFLIYSTLLMWAGMLTSNIDVTILNYYKGPTDVALYNIAYAVISVIVVLVPASGTFLLSILTEMEALGKGELQKIITDKVFKYGILFSIPISFFVFFTSNRIILFLYRPDYLQAASSLKILSIGITFFFISGMCNSIFTSKGKIKDLAYISILVALIALAAAFFLIPIYGHQGTALATLISGIMSTVLLGYASIKMLHLKFKLIYILKPVLASALTSLVIIFYLNAAVKNTIILFIIAGIIYVLLYIPMLDDDDKKLINKLISLFKISLSLH